MPSSAWTRARACRCSDRRPEHLAECRGQLGGVRVLEGIDVGAEPRLAAGLHIDLAEQIEIAGDVDAAISHHDRVGAGDDFDAGLLVGDFAQQRHRLVGPHVVEGNDLRDQAEGRWIGKRLADVKGARARTLVIRENLRDRSVLDEDESLGSEDAFEHNARLPDGNR